MVNVINNPVSFGLTVRKDEVFSDPSDDVIFESTLDHLMEQIR